MIRVSLVNDCITVVGSSCWTKQMVKRPGRVFLENEQLVHVSEMHPDKNVLAVYRYLASGEQVSYEEVFPEDADYQTCQELLE